MSMMMRSALFVSGPPIRGVRGFTMVEAMITVLVLSVGMLAIASLQATAKRSTHQAWQRSLAVSIADSIVERIRIIHRKPPHITPAWGILRLVEGR